MLNQSFLTSQPDFDEGILFVSIVFQNLYLLQEVEKWHAHVLGMFFV